MTEQSHKDSLRPYPDGYEPSAVQNRQVLGFAIGLVVMLVVIVLGLWWWQVSVSPGGPPNPQALEVDQPLQPSPEHKQTPWEDLGAMRARQQEALNAYGPMSADGGHARIPIGRAMDLLLQSGALTKPWRAVQPYQFETSPPPREAPSVRNRT